MARKRDHKAEYARRKAKARSAGYTGVSDYRRTRKQLSTQGLLTRRDQAPPRGKARALIARDTRTRTGEIAQLRREARTWSKTHSHGPKSKYRASMTDAEVRAYHSAYVAYNPEGLSRRKAARDKRRRIGEYVIQYHGMDIGEWEQKYPVAES